MLEMHIIVNKLATQYIRSGKGKTIIFLHGWGDSANTYASLIKELSVYNECIAPDLPGFGSTEPPKEPWNLDDYAAFISAFLQKVGIDEPYAIVGHSNGGAVAIRGLNLGLLKSKKLILLSSAGIRTGGGVRRFALKTVAKTGKVLTFWLPRRHRRALQKTLYGVAGSDMLVTPALKETFKRTVRQDIQADARKLSLPSLLIYGSEDKATPPTHGKKLTHLIPDSRLEILSSEHFVHQEQTTRVSELIVEFLK